MDSEHPHGRRDASPSGEALLGAALASIPRVSVIVFDRERRIQAVHGAALPSHGYVPEQLIGLRLAEAMPAAVAERLDPLCARALAGETTTFAQRSQDGRTVYESTVSPVLEDGRVVAATMTSRDMTEQSDRQASDDRAVERFEHSFVDAPVGMLLIRGHRIERANTAFARLVGMSGEDLAGADPRIFAPPAEAGRVTRTLTAAASGLTPAAEDTRLVRADGVVLLVAVRYSLLTDGDHEMPLVLVHFVDRTADVQAARQRELEHTQFEMSFSAAPVGICLLALDGRIQRVNDALCRLLARDEEQLLELRLDQLVQPGDEDDETALMRETIDGARKGYELDRRYVTATGDIVDTRLSVVLVRDADGNAVHFIAQIVDLTALVHARRELAQTTGRLQAILDYSPMAIYMRDLEERWIVANRETCGILGMPLEQLLGQSMADTISPELYEHFADHDRTVMTAGNATSFDETIPDVRSGETRHVWSLKFPVRDAEGAVVGLGGVSIDVTDRERATRELGAARALLERMFASALVGMLVSRANEDGTSDIIECNPAFARMLGCEPADLLGQGGILRLHPDDEPERRRLLDETIAGRPSSSELRFRHSDGHDVYVLATLSTTHGADGERLFILHALDISERKGLEVQLQHIADRDVLTGLFSRRRFQEELVREVTRASRTDHPGSLLLIDLDGFKQVNDTFGHAAGDELLVRLGEALRSCLRESDVLGRMGGDEFALILPDSDAAGGRFVARKLLDTVRAHGSVTRGDQRIDVTASIGITTLRTTPEVDAAQLLIEADVAMYRAKDAGRDRIAVFDARATPVRP